MTNNEERTILPDALPSLLNKNSAISELPPRPKALVHLLQLHGCCLLRAARLPYLLRDRSKPGALVGCFCFLRFSVFDKDMLLVSLVEAERALNKELP